MYIYSPAGSYLYAAYVGPYYTSSMWMTENLDAGEYRMTVEMTWGSKEVADFTVRAYSDTEVTITDDSNGA